MKMNFAYNLLKQLRSKKDEGGFTLIELLVVIIIIGILAAIALPSFLNQANRARETEATNAIGSLNRGQQAFYLEAVEYAPEMADLDVGVDQQTENFAYGTGVAAPTDGGTEGDGEFNLYASTGGTDNQLATIYAAPREGIRGFAGISYVDVVGEAGAERNVTAALICRETATQAKTAGLDEVPVEAGQASGTDAATYCADLEPVGQ